jgi:hypothetical protein
MTNYQEVMCPINDRFYAAEIHLNKKKTVKTTVLLKISYNGISGQFAFHTHGLSAILGVLPPMSEM